MALPIQPTRKSIVAEAFSRQGIANPDPDVTFRAENEWLEEVKMDVAGDRDWHDLESTQILILTPWTNQYNFDYHFRSQVAVRWYGGSSETGLVVSATSNTVTLDRPLTQDDRGKRIFIYYGTGIRENFQILTVNGSTAVLSGSWFAIPDATSAYVIPTDECLIPGPHADIRRLGQVSTDKIQEWDVFEESFHVWPTPQDQPQILALRGIVDITGVDLDSPRHSNILRWWREVIILGLRMKIQEEHDDEVLPTTMALYERKKLDLRKKDIRERVARFTAGYRPPGGIPRG